MSIKKSDERLNKLAFLQEEAGKEVADRIKEQGGKGKVRIARIMRLMENLELYKREELLEALRKNIRAEKLASKYWGAKRIYCVGCGKHWYAHHKYIKHIASCQLYIDEVDKNGNK